MAINVENKDGSCNVRLSEELTIYTCAEYRQTLLDRCDFSSPMIIDVSDINEVDTSGLQLLLALKNQQENSSIGLQFTGDNQYLADVLKHVQLEHMFNFDGVKK